MLILHSLILTIIIIITTDFTAIAIAILFSTV